MIFLLVNGEKDSCNNENLCNGPIKDNNDMLVYASLPTFNNSESLAQNLTDSQLLSIVIKDNCCYR